MNRREFFKFLGFGAAGAACAAAVAAKPTFRRASDKELQHLADQWDKAIRDGMIEGRSYDTIIEDDVTVFPDGSWMSKNLADFDQIVRQDPTTYLEWARRLVDERYIPQPPRFFPPAKTETP